jgi:hypothetical protein
MSSKKVYPALRFCRYSKGIEKVSCRGGGAKPCVIVDLKAKRNFAPFSPIGDLTAPPFSSVAYAPFGMTESTARDLFFLDRKTAFYYNRKYDLS